MANEPTKRCPYCGEEILAVAKKCKHCGEWLTEDNTQTKVCPTCGEQIPVEAIVCPFCHESKASSLDAKTDSILKPEETLYCKSCKTAISKSAQSCPHCGDDDPFFLKAIAKNKKESNIGCFTVILAAFLVIGISRLFGSEGGLINPTPTQCIIFVAIVIALHFVTKHLRKSKLDECTKAMENLSKEKNNPSALTTWKELVEKSDN